MGSKSGYGIMHDIISGEKYLGTWNDSKKHGKGLIVTSDGIYYEGVFNQGVLTVREINKLYLNINKYLDS